MTDKISARYCALIAWVQIDLDEDAKDADTIWTTTNASGWWWRGS